LTKPRPSSQQLPTGGPSEAAEAVGLLWEGRPRQEVEGRALVWAWAWELVQVSRQVSGALWELAVVEGLHLQASLGGGSPGGAACAQLGELPWVVQLWSAYSLRMSLDPCEVSS